MKLCYDTRGSAAHDIGLPPKGIFVVKRLRWVLHRFDDISKRARVTTAKSVLKNLRHGGHQAWRYLLTGDESWFFHTMDSEWMWLPEGITSQSQPRTMISIVKSWF
jgi:hypothetical protein